ncbi:MAG: antitoxin Xre/MbcA/ParS toxin-binding domain-containing protein [Hyphomicrobiales bacterium]
MSKTVWITRAVLPQAPREGKSLQVQPTGNWDVLDTLQNKCHIVTMASNLAHRKRAHRASSVKPSDLPQKTLGKIPLDMDFIRRVLEDVSAGGRLRLEPLQVKRALAKRFAAEEIDALVVPYRTMARRVARKEILTQAETDKAIRLARIVQEADRVFGNAGKADRWLRTPLKQHANQSPLDLLVSEAGTMLVEEVLGQIDHGMFA